MTSISRYHRLWPEVQALSREYAAAQPYPHIVFDDFLDGAAAEQVLGEFPAVTSAGWIHYVHVNERKLGNHDVTSFGPALRSIIQELHSPGFLGFLSELTGIEGLLADSSLEGGGLHQSQRGGFLNVHADFIAHPYRRDWRRRVNVLLYFNKQWDAAYGGHLELWDREVTQAVRKILPSFNRCVVFTTDEHSFHGHPDAIACPSAMTRKSLALYYYTKEPGLAVRSTMYRARPGDGLKRAWIALDNLALRLYHHVKLRLGVADTLASRVLKLLSRSNSTYRG